MKIEKKKPQPDVPYESLCGVPVVTPILEEEVRQQVLAAMAPFTCRIRWEKWGMKSLKKQGGAVLLWGPPGTGKTTIARWLAKKIGSGIISLSMADVGGGDPGDTERNIKNIFRFAKDRKELPTIFIDECDAVLWSREKAGPDSMWMLAVVNAFLAEIEEYQGLVILATNMKHFLDPALQRRITEEIYVGVPCMEVRIETWKAKIPADFPLQLTPAQLKTIGKYKLTGALVENAITKEARKALIGNRHPKFDSLCNIAKEYEAQLQ